MAAALREIKIQFVKLEAVFVEAYENGGDCLSTIIVIDDDLTKKIYFMTAEKLDWLQFLRYCINHGMSLLSPESENEQNKIYDDFNDKFIHMKEFFWVGYTDQGQEAKYYTVSSLKELNFKLTWI